MGGGSGGWKWSRLLRGSVGACNRATTSSYIASQVKMLRNRQRQNYDGSIWSRIGRGEREKEDERAALLEGKRCLPESPM